MAEFNPVLSHATSYCMYIFGVSTPHSINITSCFTGTLHTGHLAAQVHYIQDILLHRYTTYRTSCCAGTLHTGYLAALVHYLQDIFLHWYTTYRVANFDDLHQHLDSFDHFLETKITMISQICSICLSLFIYINCESLDYYRSPFHNF